MRITVKDLTKRFGSQEVVSRVSFSIEEGELFTLLGPSGCGKTTLLRLIAGFYAPDGGEIRFDERVVNAVPPHERGIGMVFQNYALWPHMKVHDNVAYGLKLQKIERARVEERVNGVLEKVKLAGLGGRYPASSRAVSSSAWRSRARWCSTRRSCSSTSRSPTSTPRCASRCAPRSRSCSRSSASPRST
jgi:ABC-type Fe3+/spermidine/putrescine transport system ATPase subunit